MIKKIDAWRTGSGETFLSEKAAQDREDDMSRQIYIAEKLAEVGLARGDSVFSAIVPDFTIVDSWQTSKGAAMVRLRGVLARTEDEEDFYFNVELDEFLAQWRKTV